MKRLEKGSFGSPSKAGPTSVGIASDGTVTRTGALVLGCGAGSVGSFGSADEVKPSRDDDDRDRSIPMGPDHRRSWFQWTLPGITLPCDARKNLFIVGSGRPSWDDSYMSQVEGECLARERVKYSCTEDILTSFVEPVPSRGADRKRSAEIEI